MKKPVLIGHPQAERAGLLPHWTEKAKLSPQQTQRIEHRTTAWYVLELFGSHIPFYPFNFSLLEWEHLTYVGPTIVFWKQVVS